MDVQALAMSPTPDSLRALVFFQAWDSIAAMLEEQPQWGRRGKAAKKNEGRVLPPTLGLEGNAPGGLPTSAFRARAARLRPIASPLTCVCRSCTTPCLVRTDLTARGAGLPNVYNLGAIRAATNDGPA